MDFFKFGQTTKHVSSKEVYHLCQEVSHNFDFELPVSKDNLKMYGNEFEKSQKFTALLICISVVYFKSHYKDNVYFNPHEEGRSIYLTVPFYKKLINLILEEARLIKTELMFNDLAGGFDGEDYWEEETKQYLTMYYIFNAAHQILKFKGHNNDVLSQLAYNYFETPGMLRYMSRENNLVTNEKKLELFADAVHKSFRTIILYLDSNVIDYKLENDKSN